MRQFVQSISAYAKAINDEFIVIPQNGHNLMTLNGLSSGALAEDYLYAIDGVGREDLFFGYESDDQATPAAARDEMIPFMTLARSWGIPPLVTDYVAPGSDNIPLSYAYNDGTSGPAHPDYVSFAATSRDLNNIPVESEYASFYPYEGDASRNVPILSAAHNFLYLLDPSPFADTTTYLAALDATTYDVLIIDAFDGNGDPLTAEQVAALKTKPGTDARRLVIAYMSISEAERYRYYWDAGWDTSPPAFLGPENPDWPGNFKVRYWDPAWQAIITGNSGSYLQKLLNVGFDGAYLDIIDAFEYWEE
jgi:cysteinyl-tRNA synthetase